MPENHQHDRSGENWYRYALALEASEDGFWDWAPKPFGQQPSEVH